VVKTENTEMLFFGEKRNQNANKVKLANICPKCNPLSHERPDCWSIQKPRERLIGKLSERCLGMERMRDCSDC